MNYADKYAKDVVSGKILTGRFVKLSCQLHLDNHKRDDLYFDAELVDKIVKFVEKCLCHWEGQWRGQPMLLSDWQKFVVQNIFGWKYKETDLRLYRSVYIEIARKNGKTTFASVIALICLLIDSEKTPQILVGANNEDQAKICTNSIGNILEISPAFSDLIRRSEISIFKYAGKTRGVKSVWGGKDGSITAMSKEANTKDGFNPSLGIIDEYHEAKTDALLNVIRSGQGARKEPLLVVITTAGFNKNGVCYAKLRNMSIKALDKVEAAERHFSMIYEMDEEDDWEDETNWIKANPMIQDMDTLIPFLKTEIGVAKSEGGTSEVNFKTKNLNMWTNSAETWISAEDWADQQEKVSDLRYYPCYGGMDLASTRDLTAYSLIFDCETHYHLKTWYWLPEERLMERVKEGYVYDQWVNEGWIRLTSGNVTDYDEVEQDIKEINSQYNFQNFNYDRHFAYTLVSNLEEIGFKGNPFSQTFGEMNVPTTEFEKFVFQDRITHDGNPVTKWMLSNVEILRDTRGLIKVSKKEADKKVDGVVSAIMAFAAAYSKDNFNDSVIEIW